MLERAINRFSVEKTADGFTPSNYVETRTFDAEAVTPMELADVVATLLSDIKDRGPKRR